MKFVTSGKTKIVIMKHSFLLASVAVILLSLSGCEYCENRGSITFDNTRLWCNCDITLPSGDEYVVFAGEARTFEFFSGRHTIEVNCGETAWQNDITCFFENGIREFTFNVDCEDQLYFDLDF